MDNHSVFIAPQTSEAGIINIPPIKKIDQTHLNIQDRQGQGRKCIVKLKYKVFLRYALCSLPFALFIPQGFDGVKEGSLSGRIESEKYSYGARENKS
jgi:hypothetical protein